MKKVLICYHSSQYGGVEKHILDIVKGLSSKFEIFVACPKGPLVEDYLKAGAIKHFDIAPKFEADFGYSMQIRKIIKEEEISVIHSHELLTGSLATFGGLLAACPKRIYHVHTSFTQWKYSSLKKYPALFINTFVNFIVGNFFATDVIALTESVKTIRINKELISAKRIRVIPNGVHLDNFSFDQVARNDIRKRYDIDEDHFVLGNIARFTIEKGHEVLIEAFKQIQESKTEKKYVLMLAGSGELEGEIQKLVRNYDLADKVKFLGSFDESDKNKILSAFDCFIFPSYAEGFGIALVEAMATGIPCISSDLGVLKDVAGNSAEYFKTGSAKDLKNRILELSSNEQDMKKLAEEGKEAVRKYSMGNFWHQYINLYNS